MWSRLKSGFTAWFRALGLAIGIAGASPCALGAEDKVLDFAGLGVMLENLGYEHEAKEFSGGLPYHQIVKSGVIRMTAKVYISKSTDFVWLIVDYWTLKKDQKYPYNVLLELLEQNNNTSYMSFAYLPDQRGMRLNGNLINRNVKPVDLRKLIDDASKVTDRTQHLWNPNKWKVQPEPEPVVQEDKPELAEEETEKVN